ncbi:MAG: DUF418 domain-containing protein [Planctomycetes bacterium]|nr:DUF418 domain-containing protein [Planctomycetota bacterium]
MRNSIPKRLGTPMHENENVETNRPLNSGQGAAPAAAAERPDAAPSTATPGPVAQAERIRSLDVLRGFALLGILIMNIQVFAMIFAAYFNPHAYGDLTGPNYAVWWLSHVLADRKLMTIFSMLFGAGIVLMTSRREDAVGRCAGLHYRRMAVLLALGLCHAYLLWDGDILVTYAICGMVVYPFRRRRPRTLIVIGLILIAFASGISFLSQWGMQYWPQSEVRGLSDELWQPPPEKVQETLALYRGTWAAQLPARVSSAFFFQTFVLLIENLWRVSGLMLAGMALFKLGVFSATRTTRTYVSMVVAGVLIGVPLIVAGVVYRDSVNWDIRRCFFVGGQFNYWGSLPMALAWVGLVMLVCRSAAAAAVLRPLAAVGRMAFTNYLLQSVICTTLFFGQGFGWYGHVERVGQFGVVLGVWAIQLVLSPLWLRSFRFGPAEWLWRSLTYRARQPFKR